jgi:hypothetical protein
MHIKPCRPYHAKLAGTSRIVMPDQKSQFKLYYFSLIGRDDPARFEWEHASLKPEQFEACLVKNGLEGVGFITAFPHITKVFRFAPSMETVLHVRAYSTMDMKAMDLSREDNFLEFACYVEAVIAAAEYKIWAQSRTVPEYLAAFGDFADGAIIKHDKLAEYAERSK